MSGVLVLGAGGHGKVVADILIQAGRTVLGFLDDSSEKWDSTCFGLPVLGSLDSWGAHHPEGLVLGIGSNHARRAIVERLGLAAHSLWVAAVHPHAIVARSVAIGAGTVIAAGAVLNPDARLGKHVIVNTGATVDHDCHIGDFAHIAPGTHLAGVVKVGEGAFLGIGGAVIPERSIGDWAVVGAGAVVTENIPTGVTAIGVPARWI